MLDADERLAPGAAGALWPLGGVKNSWIAVMPCWPLENITTSWTKVMPCWSLVSVKNCG